MKKEQLSEMENLKGKIKVKIHIDASGNIAYIEINGINGEYSYALENKIRKIITTTSGKWKPGTHRGKPAEKVIEKTISFE